MTCRTPDGPSDGSYPFFAKSKSYRFSNRPLGQDIGDYLATVDIESLASWDF